MDTVLDEFSATASPDSTASASDSEASSRVYFGPLQSPEKKFVPNLARRRTLHANSPTRRSPRLSIPDVSSPLRDGATSGNECGDYEGEEDGRNDESDGVDDETARPSRLGTPENDQFPLDEPSSVLADKVMHAHDNPSPPPQTRALPDHSTTSTPSMEEVQTQQQFPLVDISDSPTPQLPIQFQDTSRIPNSHDMEDQLVLQIGASPLASSEPSSVLPALVLHKASPQLELSATTSQRDLISFESLSTTPSASHHLGTSAPGEPYSPTAAFASSIADSSLFYPSPVLSLPRTRSPDVTMQYNQTEGSLQHTLDPTRRSAGLSNSRELSPGGLSLPRRDAKPYNQSQEYSSANNGTLESHTEAFTGDELISSNTDRPSDSLSVLPDCMGPPLPPLPVLISTPQLKGIPAQMSVRRSARCSVTPSPLPGVHALTDGMDCSRFETPPLVKASQPLARKKRWKGKERAASPEDEFVSDSQNGSVDSGSREASTSTDVSSADKTEERTEDTPKESHPLGKQRRSDRKNRPEDKMRRELRSLSPDSTDVLTQIYTSSKVSSQEAAPADPPNSKGPPHQEAAVGSSTPARPTSSIFPTRHPNLSVASIAAGVQRPSILKSPVRGHRVPASPAKLGGALDDPARTPARRIPIQRAVAQGTISPLKASQLSVKVGGMTSLMRSPVFIPQSLDDPMRSPARRIPVSEAVVVATGKRMGSPVRGMSIERARSGSMEPRPQGGRKPSGSVECQQEQLPSKLVGGKNGPLTRPTLASTPLATSQLPFPLVATPGSGTDIPRSLSDDSQPSSTIPRGGINGDLPESNSSPPKSNLRHSSVASRIPRVGVKPYARPTTASRKESGSKLPTIAKKHVGSTSGVHTSRRFAQMGSESSSDDLTTRPVASGTAPQSKGTTDTTDSSSLKRKRAAEKPSSPRPVVVIRQTASTMLKYAPKPTFAPANQPQNQPDASPVKGQQGQAVLPRGVDQSSGRRRDKGPEHRLVETEVVGGAQYQDQDNFPSRRHHVRDEEILVAGSYKLARKENTPPSSPILPEPSSPSSNHAATPAADRSSILSSPPDIDAESSGRVRRTTRIRKPVQPGADVFGTIAVRPLQPRRKAPPSSRSEPVFAGMSAVALKALTTSNTAKNQQYLAAKLETEVIRKEGARPESPTVKVRTILQRQREEKDKGRKERADRRARRSVDGSGGLSDCEGQTDCGDSSMIAEDEPLLDIDEYPMKHRRGPGDEEDYETPEKVERSTKRMRFEEEERERKRVKWDRGLSSTIYLDEIEFNPKPRPKEDVTTRKGCLAKTAKSLRLDTLGNHPHADTPLTDLVHENIVVKKFVYDNDVEPPAPIVKVTRSKSKKSKP